MAHLALGRFRRVFDLGEQHARRRIAQSRASQLIPRETDQSPPTPGGFFLASPTVAPLQAIDGDNKVGPPEHLHQLLKDALVIVRSRLSRYSSRMRCASLTA